MLIRFFSPSPQSFVLQAQRMVVERENVMFSKLTELLTKLVDKIEPNSAVNSSVTLQREEGTVDPNIEDLHFSL